MWLNRWLNWPTALAAVMPNTFIGWHREGFQLFCLKKCQASRPRIPPDLRRLIREMAGENPREARSELLLKLGLRLSPRSIRKCLPNWPALGGNPRRDQRWSTFLKNHAQAIVACDSRAVTSATFLILDVFIVMEHGSRYSLCSW